MDTKNSSRSDNVLWTIFKWIAVSLFFFCFLGTFFEQSYISSVVFLFCVLLAFPPLSAFWRNNVSFLSNRYAKGGILIALFFVGMFSAIGNSNKNKVQKVSSYNAIPQQQNTENNSTSQYQENEDRNTKKPMLAFIVIVLAVFIYLWLQEKKKRQAEFTEQQISSEQKNKGFQTEIIELKTELPKTTSDLKDSKIQTQTNGSLWQRFQAEITKAKIQTKNNGSLWQHIQEDYKKNKQNNDKVVQNIEKYVYPDGKKDIVSFWKYWAIPSIFIGFIFISFQKNVSSALITFGIGLLLSLPFLKDFWIGKVPFLANRLLKYGLLFCLFIAGLIMTPKGEIEKTKNLPYEIAETKPYETSNKRQIGVYAYLTTDTFTKETINEVLNDIYKSVKSYNNFKSIGNPTVIGIYLFTSKHNAEKQDERWVGWLSKTPSDNEPRITIDESRYSAQTGLNDNVKTNSEIKLDELNAYLKERNTSLCFIYEELDRLSLESIHEADIAYPDFGIEHSEFQEQLYKEAQKQLFKKYQINDTLSTYISVFGYTYCK